LIYHLLRVVILKGIEASHGMDLIGEIKYNREDKK